MPDRQPLEQLGPVAVDAMGGDGAPAAIIDGAVRAARQGLAVLLVGDEAVLRPLVPGDVDLPVLHAPDVVAMDEAPAAAARGREGASVRVAVQAVADGRAVAALSCGNTGALMASGLFGLGRQEGVERPAIATLVPRLDGGQLVVLDLGANVDCKPSHIASFSIMGHAFSHAVVGTARPRVGLLSNGHEEGKGNEQVKAAHILLSQQPVDYIGQIEPREALHGACDVLVCDGFVGNVLLKTMEAATELVGTLLRQELSAHARTRMGAWMLSGPLVRFRERTDYAAIGGAVLLGVKGLVVAGHGRADAAAVDAAIRHAHRWASARVVERVGAAVSSTLAVRQLDG